MALRSCTLVAALLAAASGASGQPLEGPPDSPFVEVRFGQRVRVSNTVARIGGATAPTTWLAESVEGTSLGTRENMLLLEVGATDPLYWIPLDAGRPVVEIQGRRAAPLRGTVVGGLFGMAAGATAAWALWQECDPGTVIFTGGSRQRCGNTAGRGSSILSSAAGGLAIGGAIGYLLGRVSSVTGWEAVPVDRLEFEAPPLSRPGTLSASVRLR